MKHSVKQIDKKTKIQFIAALHNRAEIFSLIGQLDEALKDALTALQCAEELDEKIYIGETYELLASIYSKSGDYQKMKESAEQSLIVYKEIGDRSGQSTSLGYISDYYLFSEDVERALELAIESRDMSENTNDLKSIAGSISNIGIIYSDFIQEYEKSMQYHKKTLEISRKADDKEMEAASLNNLGNVYQLTGQIDKVGECFSEAIEIAESIGDKQGVSSIYNNIGAVNFFNGSPDDAVMCFKRSLEIRREIGDRRGCGVCLNNLGYIYEEMGQSNNALESFNEALKIRRGIGDNFGVGETLINIANYYRDHEDYEKALKNFAEAESIKEKLHEYKGVVKALIGKGHIYRITGKTDKAEQTLKRVLNRDDLEPQAYFEASCELYHTMRKRNEKEAERILKRAETFMEEAGENERAEKIRELGESGEK